MGYVSTNPTNDAKPELKQAKGLGPFALSLALIVGLWAAFNIALTYV